MNSFHSFSIAIQNRDKNKAMLIIRDKTESVARRILAKARVRVPEYTGRIFWAWVQNYIISECTPQQADTNATVSESVYPSETGHAHQPGGHRCSQGNSVSGHAARPLQHAVSESPGTGAVCDRQDGVSPVYPDVGGQCLPPAGKSSEERKPAMGLGFHHPAGVRPDIQRSASLVRAQYFIRVCGRHAAACVTPPVRPERSCRRRGAVRDHDVPAVSRQLRTSGAGSGAVGGSLVQFIRHRSQTGRCRHRGCRPGHNERHHAPYRFTRTGAVICRPPYCDPAFCGHQLRRVNPERASPPVSPGPVLLLRVYRPPPFLSDITQRLIRLQDLRF